MKMGDKIKHFRDLIGLSQRELASELNIFHTAVAKWECNECLPNIYTILKMCKIFNITIDEFVEDVDF